jgi:tetratricopeptide (TPR) repeat protein
VVASEAAKRWPDDSRTHFYRAQALALLGASQRAIDDFRKAAEAGSDPYLWHKLAAYALVLDEPALGRQWAERGMNDPRLNRPQRGRCLVHAATAVYLSDGPEAAAALLDEHADLVRGSSFWPAAAEFLRHRVGLADLVTHAGGPDEWAAAHLLAGLLQEAAGDVDAARQLYRQVSRPGDEPVPYEYVARVGVGALMGVR